MSKAHDGPGDTGKTGSVPLSGKLVALKTREECRAANDTIDVFVVEIPLKSANAVLKHVKQAIPDFDAVDVQHLRRFARQEYLPDHLKSQTLVVDELGNASSKGPSLHLLVCPVSVVKLEDLETLLSTESSLLGPFHPPEIKSIPVPFVAPTSAEQAARWSTQYWPTIYKANNPYGPHPATVRRAEAEIAGTVCEYMKLAYDAAQESATAGTGERAACVVVERKDGKAEIVTVAGDGRWSLCGKSEISGPENVMAHAVMRAIGMVARKRIRVVAQTPDSSTFDETDTQDADSIFVDLPQTPLERSYFDRDNIVPNGYLCLDLEIYITHEPCVMCAMAIQHSRFGKCVFGKRMPLTGGMTADGEDAAGLGYGLFWRPDLTWKFLAWEWVMDSDTDGDLPEDEVRQDTHI